MTKVLATGVFNILHPGHAVFLEESKKLGDELVVIVSSDRIATKISKKKVLPQEQRARMIELLKPVDKVFVGDDEDTMKLLPVIKPDVITLGHDQDVDIELLKDQLNLKGLTPEIVRIKKKWEGELNSTTKILRALNKP